ncbi:MAG: hypothetical protein WC071_12355 [Victivallaceae bacterium]
MARALNGRLYKHGKNGAFRLQYSVNGVVLKLILKDDAGKPITNLREAELARDKIFAPYLEIEEAERQKLAYDASLK